MRNKCSGSNYEKFALRDIFAAAEKRAAHKKAPLNE